ncbi:MAG: LPS-assembly protein LptD, partial [Proteobacteria bacterium]|nr:LPS-assembly protein LptD [Pseudomonadota bacterium]
TGTLPPLRVDPALLGLPAVAAAPAVAVPARAAPSAAGPDGMPGFEVLPDDGPEALSLRLAARMVPPPAKSDVPRPAFVSAQRMSGVAEREMLAEGEVELRKIGTVVNADTLTYWPLDDELEAQGSVRLQQNEDVLSGPRMRLRVEEQVGFFEQPAYFLKRQPKPAAGYTPVQLGVASDTGFAGFAPPASSMPSGKSLRAGGVTEARGEAERFEFEGENRMRMHDATFTTCKPGNDDWYASVGELALDYDREVADGRDAAVYFKGVPILYSPWLSFSLNSQRKSGLLSPTFGTTSKSGIELALPYYWNIAPNMDATITPRVYSKRGLQMNTEFRYLDAAFSGQARVEMLPGDKVRDANRYGVSLQHVQNFGHGLTGSLNYNKVSDDNYYTDLSSRIANTSQTQLLQQGVLTWAPGSWWNVTGNLQSYQTLQPDANNPVVEPYRLLPQVTFNARRPDWYLTDSALLGQYTAFTHSSKVEGRRTVLYPQVALPFVTPGWYVTPKVGVHATHWTLSRQAEGTPDSLTRTLPVVSVDAGMTFERPSNWFGRDYTQTLEPRLYYLNVPYRDQSRIPLFDTALADFNFAQIFAENQFVGQDRFNDANQLTAAVTSRLVDPATGAEIMRGMIGQRFYFSDQQVTLDGATRREWNKSDFLAAFSGQVLPRVYADAALQYNFQNARTERMALGGRWQPEPGKVFNAAYRYTRDALDQVDFSGQWPLFGGWHAVGRYNYSLKEKQPVETIGGLEYDGGCWIVRMVGQRLATSAGTASTALFLQLELSEFSRIGSNPLELLKRNIQGYGRINQPTDDPVFGQ